VPIEEYGKKILANLGWHEGMGVGRNKVIVEPVNIKPRPQNLGLGAKPSEIQLKKFNRG
jgi:hypothetical protein